MKVRTTVTSKPLTEKEKTDVVTRSGYANTKNKFYVSIEEYKDDCIWNVIAVYETSSKLEAQVKAQDIAKLIGCCFELKY